LEDEGLLLRCFTQNIDSLEELAGVSPDRIMAAHGNFSSAHGIDTGKEVPIEEVKQAVQRGEEGWKELTERCGELIKPDIVFFGEALPARFRKLVETDFGQCDLLIVMGTSLVVAPFCTCITFVDKKCPRLLINREPAGLEGSGMSDTMRGGFRFEDKARNYRDVFQAGDCDSGVEALCAELGWSKKLADVCMKGRAKPNDVTSRDLDLGTAASVSTGNGFSFRGITMAIYGWWQRLFASLTMTGIGSWLFPRNRS